MTRVDGKPKHSANGGYCDPALFEEDGQVYLLYSVAGERGIALARVAIGG